MFNFHRNCTLFTTKLLHFTPYAKVRRVLLCIKCVFNEIWTPARVLQFKSCNLEPTKIFWRNSTRNRYIGRNCNSFIISRYRSLCGSRSVDGYCLLCKYRSPSMYPEYATLLHLRTGLFPLFFDEKTMLARDERLMVTISVLVNFEFRLRSDFYLSSAA